MATIRFKHFNILILVCALLGMNHTATTALSQSQLNEQVSITHAIHPSLSAERNPRVLFLALKLRKDTYAADERTVESLRNLKWFTHVILATSSLHETPNAIRHPLVQRALKICRENDKLVLWARWLWVAWPDPAARVPHPNSHFDPAYYATAIATVRAEAKAIGAIACCLDVEPYGKNPQKSMKGKLLSGSQLKKMADAISTAVLNAGKVDCVYPTSSNRPERYIWPLVELGQLRFDEKTYYTKGPNYKFPKIRPPKWTSHRVDFWGCNVGLGIPGDDHPDYPRLTSRDVIALDMSVIRNRHKECRGVWVYIDYDLLPEVLRRWGQ